MEQLKFSGQLPVLAENVLELFPCPVYKISTDLTFLYLNAAARKLKKIDLQLARHRHCYEMLGKPEICSECPVVRALQSRQPAKRHKCEFCQDNKIVVMEQIAIPILAADGSVEYVLEVDNDVTTVLNLQQQNETNVIQTIFAFAKLIEERDGYTGRHSENVHNIAMHLGRQMELSAAKLADLSAAALLHDIGKIGIPEAILMKPGPLTAAERKEIERHPVIGFDVLSKVSLFSKVAEYVLCHHERMDGKGYPNQRQGNEIPLISRILTVADVFEALIAFRVYRPALPLPIALNIIAGGRGNMFDPEIVDCLFALLKSQQGREMILAGCQPAVV